MSFLNPVNEPVLRFSSTDADAPQINYAARTAGDVKAVLKACLVTGYGDKASAGWSIVNEVDHVCEFVSPRVAMSDYRLGIDDTSTSSTAWYYQYQDARVNPSFNAPTKAFTNIIAASADNGWELLVTSRGFYFAEVVMSSAVNSKVCRITYFGQVKSVLTTANIKNIGFFNVGWNGIPVSPPEFFMPDKSKSHYVLANFTNLNFASIDIERLKQWGSFYQSTVIANAALYLRNANHIVAQQPGLLTTTTDPLYGVNETTIKDRPALYLCAAFSYNTAKVVADYARGLIIYLDYWEY